MLSAMEVHMSEEDLEVLVTIDDPGEDTLEEDKFDHLQTGTVAYLPDQPVSSSRPNEVNLDPAKLAD
jgi:hypothetical protein